MLCAPEEPAGGAQAPRPIGRGDQGEKLNRLFPPGTARPTREVQPIEKSKEEINQPFFGPFHPTIVRNSVQKVHEHLPTDSKPSQQFSTTITGEIDREDPTPGDTDEDRRTGPPRP